MNGLTSTPAQRWLARLSCALAGAAIVILPATAPRPRAEAAEGLGQATVPRGVAALSAAVEGSRRF